ncbi:MAG: ABC transporter ATP-binding protein [Candidatus Kapaibacterium sp.]|jgi:ABC-type multidrug transport system fused ATPase/permease subunit
MLIKLYKRLLPFARRYRGRILLATFFNVISSVMSTVIMVAIIPIERLLSPPPPEAAKAIDALKANQSIFDTFRENVIQSITHYFLQGTQTEALFKLCAFVFLGYAFKNIFQYLNNYLMAIAEGGMVKSLRDAVFEKMSMLSLDYYYDRKAGHLLSRLTNDVSMVNSTLTSSIVTVVGQPVQIIIYLFLMITINTKLTLISLGIAVLSFYLITLFGKSLKSLSHKLQSKQGDILTVAQESIGGVKVVKSFGMEQYEINRFKEETREHYKWGIRLARIRQTISPLNETVAVCGFIGILWFGGHEVFKGTMHGSELWFFLLALIQLMQPIRNLSDLNSRLYEGSAAAENLFAILDAKPSVAPGTIEVAAKHTKPIHFENVHFKYASQTENALNGIDLELFPGETLALVGPSGAGKTTLVDLLARFYDPTEGNIYLEGNNLREYSLESLRRLFGIVTQDTVLFHDTIYNNISYGNRNATEEMVYEAARAANAHEFIQQIPTGYQTMAGDRGVRLSGGQRQRIAIARALLKNPPILIFDEATSALDTENEMLVQEAIERLLKERTAVVIAHRLSTIKQADRIAVMSDGRIVELGTHDELLAMADGLYQRLYTIQMRAGSESIVTLG